MYQQTYVVPKRSGTLADSLLAYGLATLLHNLIQKVPGRKANRQYRIRLEDAGSHYRVCLPEPIQEAWLSKSSISCDLALPVLRTAKPKDDTKSTSKKSKPAKKALPDDLTPIDYNAIWEEIRSANALIEAQQKQHGHINQQEIQELKESFCVQPYREVALMIGDYRMQVEGIHNQAVVQWYTTVKEGYQAANLLAILTLFSSLEPDMEAIEKAWSSKVKLPDIKKRLTASQVFNPGLGKGQNQPKADRLTMGNEEQFWLLEYLKAVGLFAAAAPLAFTKEHIRKTYVLAPSTIELSDHKKIFEKYFKPVFFGLNTSPIKADILAALDYANAYLSYYSQEDSELDRNPRTSIRGFYVASYMLLSQNSYTLINLSFLGLPPWLAHIHTNDDVVIVQQIIDEHKACIRPLQEEYQEGSMLLDTYRDFLTGDQCDAFFDFCAGYGDYVISTLPANRFVRQFRVASLDELFRRIDMGEYDPTDFMSTSQEYPGFHEIAYAIRHSTVIPQRQNAQHKSGKRDEKSLYEVRYGLGNNLRRKTETPEEFVEALTEFIHIYNAETEQVFERTSEERKHDSDYARKHYRRRVSISDLDDVLALVKKHGPRLVCNMLVAYGYSTESRKNKGDQYADGNDSPVESNTLDA